MATKEDVQELVTRYLNIESEIKLLQEDRKDLLSDFKDKVEPKVFRAAMQLVKTRSKLNESEVIQLDQVAAAIADKLNIEHLD